MKRRNSQRHKRKRLGKSRWMPSLEQLEQRLPLKAAPLVADASIDPPADKIALVHHDHHAKQGNATDNSVDQALHAQPLDAPDWHIVDDGHGRLALDDMIPAPEGGIAPIGAPGLLGAPVPLADLVELNSNSAATATIFLDFDGHSETTWGSFSNVVIPVFDTDSDNTTFSDAEVALITEVWQRVSEDFSPFDINVTTVEPSDFSDGVAVRVAVGGDGAWTGDTLGGAAYLDSFTNSLANTVFVFSDNLSDSARNIAEATSHEVGHSFGLEHQSLYEAGALTEEYNPGNAVWAPIMGVSYYSAQTLWHNGPTSSAETDLQDDLALLSRSANGFGYRTDDHGSVFSSASTVSVGSVSESGIIEQMDDQDVFTFTTAASGQVDLTASVAAVGSNLDIALELYSADEELLFSDDPSSALSASVDTVLDAGTYYVVIASSGEYGELGQYTLTGTIPDNNPPVLDTIDDQTMVHNVGSLDITLSATDPDSDPVTFTAAAVVVDSVAVTASQLNQDHGLVAAINEFLNFRGLNEKYLQGAGDTWFYVLPDGEVYQWGGSVADSTLLATLNSDYYDDLSLLYDAAEQPYTTFNGTVSVTGTTLTVDPDAGVTGVFGVTVTASDGDTTDTQTFGVTVTNEAPVVASINDQTLAHNVDSLDVTLSATDGDSDTVTYSATAAQQDPAAATAYELDQTHNFTARPGEYENFRGLQEKYFVGASGAWFYVLPTGAVYQWGGSVAASTLLGTTDSSYHADLSKFYDVEEPEFEALSTVATSLSGTTLTINPDTTVVGEFTVAVTASDGIAEGTQSFTVTVTNSAPVLAAIDNQTLSHAVDSLDITLSATDGDGDTLTYTAEAGQQDPTEALAYQLDQTHDFYAASNEFLNFSGQNEKYFHGDGTGWFYVLPTGAVYQVGSSIADSTLLGTLDSTYYDTLSLLFDVSEPETESVDVTVSLTGTTLTLDPASTFLGNATITVTASDGAEEDTVAFNLAVTNDTPVLDPIDDQTMSYATDTLDVALSGTDADGDTITYSVTSSEGDVTGSISGTTLTLDPSSSFLGDATITVTADDGIDQASESFLLSVTNSTPTLASIDDQTIVHTTDTLDVTITAADDDGDSLTLTATSSETDVSTSISGTTLTLDPADLFAGTATITVTVDDGSNQVVETFTLAVTNQAPVLGTIADQTIAHNLDTLDVTLSATDGDSDTVTFTATAGQQNAIDLLAYQLDQSHDFFAAADESLNFRGANEKYFRGDTDGWFYILPDGEVYEWGGSIETSTLQETLDATFYADLTKLFDVVEPALDPVAVTLTVDGTTLTIDPDASVLGEFVVTVTGTDGIAEDTATFDVTVTNTAPVLATIADQPLSYATDTLDVSISATDAEGDTLTYTVVSSESDVTGSISGTTLTLDPASSFLGDATITVTANDGAEEDSTSFVLSVTNSTPTIVSIGDQSIPHTTDTLDLTITANDADADSLTLAAASSEGDVSASISGTTLTLDPVALFAGTATITVTADDGSTQATETFTLTVTNQAPVLGAIADQTITHNLDTVDITLSATDGNSDTITYTATAGQRNPTEVLAYQLDQAHDFFAASDEFLNFSGQNEKYFRGDATEWFYILPSGAVYQVGSSIADSTLLGTLNSSYHDDLTTLFDVVEPLPTESVDVTLSVSDNTLTLDPAASYTGEFIVTVVGTDGIDSDTTTFNATVTNSAPTLDAIADQSMSHTIDTLDVALSVTDGDADTLTYTVTSSETDVTGSVTGTTLTLDPTSSFLGDATITVTVGDGAAEDTQSFTLSVTNDAPVLTAIVDQSMSYATDTLDVTISASDADSDTLSYTVTSSETDVTGSIDETTLTLDPASSFWGDATITVTADDGIAQHSTTFILSVTNSTPVLDPITDQSIPHTTDTLDVALSVTDADADSVTLTAASSESDVATSITGTTLTLDPAALFAGTATITVTADDGNTQAVQSFTLTVTNQAPVLDAIVDQTLVHNVDTLDVTLSATDGNSDTLTYTVASSETDVTGSISGTTLTLDPASSFVGDATITVTASDGIEQDSVSFALSVTNETPVLVAISDQSMSHTTDTLDVTLSGSDADSDPLTYTVASSESDVTGSITGTTLTLDPASSFLGDVTITVTADDGLAQHDVSFVLSVTNAAPVLDAIVDQTLVHNVDTLDVALSATDADSDTISYSVASSTTDVTGSITGTTLTLDPASSFLGDATITVTADDGIAQHDVSFLLSVTNTDPVLDPISDETIPHTTDTLDVALSVTDADSDTLTYTVVSSETDVTGSVTGTTLTLDPAALFAGAATITVTAADPHAQATQTFTLTVTNQAPVLDPIVDQAMSYATDTLDVTLSTSDGNSDTLTLTVSSSETDVTGSITGSTLTLDPTSTFLGDATITVTADDGIEQASQSFVLTVTNSTPDLTAIADETMSHATDTLDVELTVSDADADSVTLTATSSESDVTTSISGSNLTLDPAALFTGTATITVTADDGNTQAEETFTLTVTNQIPFLDPIADQTMGHNVDTLDVTLSTTDGDGDTVTYTTSVVQLDPVEVLAYQLDQAHDFFAASSENLDLLGLQEKWFRGDTFAWFYILPDGEIVEWGGTIGTSTSLGTLDATYHSDLTTLFDVAAPTEGTVDVTASISGTTLTLDPAVSVFGTFTVTVTASDSIAEDTETFDVTVTNSAPALTTIADQQLSYATDTLDVSISATDGDGDTITYSVSSSETDVSASLTGTTLTLDPASSFLGDATITVTADDGAEESAISFVLSVTNSTPTIASIGDQSIPHTTDTLDLTITANDADADSITLTAASTDSDVSTSITGTTLTLDPVALYTGTATITVTADDGNTQATETFTLTVTNQAPVLDAISDQTITHNLDTVDITLSATDGNSDTVTYSATAVHQNLIDLLAYQLDQAHDFFAASNEFLNFRGVNEKYFRGDTDAWFYILPTGAVYEFGTTIADSTLLGTLDGTFYGDLTALFDVAEPPVVDATTEVGISISGSTLTLDPIASYTGTVTVTVTATDGIDSDTTTFDATVTNSAPALDAITDQSMSHTTDTLDVALSVTDGDGDTLTYTVTSSETDVTGSVTGTTLTLDPTSSFLGDATITVTVGDGAAEDTQSFTLSVTNDAPVLTAIVDQSMSYATDTLDVTISASDADSDTLTYTVTSSETDVTGSISGTTLTLDPASSFLGDATITVTADDGTAQDSTTFVLSVTNSTPVLDPITDQSIPHTTDTLDVALSVTDADADSVTLTASSSESDVATSITGTTLTLDPVALFTGTATITVTADDGSTQAEQSFTLTVTNQAPVLATLTDQTMAHNVDTLDVTLSATDGDSDTITYTTTAAQQNPVELAAYQLDQSHNFFAASDEFLNFRGVNEKYFRGDTDEWFYILPDGAVYQWGGSIASSTLLETLDATFYADLTKLYDVAEPALDPADVTLSLSGTTLTIDPAVSVTGDFVVTVTATDGIDEDTGTFTVTVTNTAPVLDDVTDQTLSHATDTLDVTLSSTDAEGDAVTYTAESSDTDVAVSVSGSTLTLDPASSFLGDVTITVTASDGAEQDSTSFQLSVTNAAPTIAAIADQTMLTTTDTIDVTVTASDADGDSVTLSATAVEIDLLNQAAYALDQIYDFQPAPEEYLNFHGANEKYFLDAEGNWFYILPTGAVYQFGTSFGDSTLLDTLDSSYHSDLTTLYDVVLQETAVTVGLTFSGSTLTIDPQASYVGTIQITVTASDGTLSATELFNLTVDSSSIVVPGVHGLTTGLLMDAAGGASGADKKVGRNNARDDNDALDSLFGALAGGRLGSLAAPAADEIEQTESRETNLTELDALEEIMAVWNKSET